MGKQKILFLSLREDKALFMASILGVWGDGNWLLELPIFLKLYKQITEGVLRL